MKTWKIIMLAIGDLVAAYASLFLMLKISFGEIQGTAAEDHILPFSVIFGIWIIVLFIFDQYDPIAGRPKVYNMKRLGYALTTAFFTGTIVFYVGQFGINPKLNLLLVFVFFVILYISWRRIIFKLLGGAFVERVYFLDSNEYVSILKSTIKGNPQLGYALVETESESDIVISKIPFSRGKKLLSLAGAYESIMQKIPVDIAEKTLGYQIESRQENILGVFLKRSFDIIFSLTALAATSWLWPIIIAGIKLDDRGPVLYTHKRVGLGNKPFSFIKFRSMKVDAEKGGAVWAEKEDSRVTKFGRFLRKSHLDEIPQMINVLRGDMSVVGPRPERPEFVSQLEEEIPLYDLRHIIKPGFTGWAQIKYRYARTVSESKEKFEYDLYYIKNKSFILDMGVMLKTVQIVVTHL
jgi:lipopolysaccharide/colanic/teichoic acid biosynthesis glycosyltransferase